MRKWRCLWCTGQVFLQMAPLPHKHEQAAGEEPAGGEDEQQVNVRGCWTGVGSLHQAPATALLLCRSFLQSWLEESWVECEPGEPSAASHLKDGLLLLLHRAEVEETTPKPAKAFRLLGVRAQWRRALPGWGFPRQDLWQDGDAPQLLLRAANHLLRSWEQTSPGHCPTCSGGGVQRGRRSWAAQCHADCYGTSPASLVPRGQSLFWAASHFGEQEPSPRAKCGSC